jgi:hypothetical protein
MNVFAANDVEAADLLALARLDDDGAPPARASQDRHAVRLPGAGQVTVRHQAEMIAAARRGLPESRPAP